MSEKFRFPIEGDADRVVDRMPFSDSPEGLKEILKPSDEQELQALIEQQSVDEAAGFGGDIAEAAEAGVNMAVSLIKKGSKRTPASLLLNPGMAAAPTTMPDLTDINDPTRNFNLGNWGSGEHSPKNYQMTVNSFGEPVIFFHASPNFIGDTLDPSYAQLRDPGYFGEGAYLSSRANESGKYLEKQHYFGKMSEEEKTGKYKEFHTEKKNPKIIPTYLRFEKALRLTAPEGEKGVESFVADDINAAEIKNGLMELLFKLKGVDPTNENDTAAISEIKTNFGENEDFNTPTKIRKFLSQVGAKNKRGTELQITQFLKTLGYDGVLVIEDATRPHDYAEAIIFNKGQAKHATENAGTFLESDDLYTKTEKKDSEIHS
tara:strand:- start:1924 stop:3048 length:1125 start_codon:yes stop_codon:yes gene_type:complete